MPSGKKVDKDYRALVLAEAKMLGKSEASRRHNVSERSIYNWSQKLEEDQELSEKYREKQRYLEFRWTEHIPKLIESASECIDRCLKESPSDPKTMDSAIRVLELCSQMQISLKAKQDELESVGVKINREGS